MFQRAASASSPNHFSGPVYISTLLSGENAADAPELHYVVFDPGVINDWHTHAGGQILIATDGIGYHQVEGQPVEVLHPGDVAYCPPGVKHWHGGSADSTFAHIAVNTNPERPGVEWFDRISETEYRQLSADRFTDVPDGAWYAEAANWCREQNILTGSTFAADTPMTRSTVADALYRAEGSPAVQSTASFSDVPVNSPYANAASWASANGIMSGYGGGRFGGEDPVTREQMASILGVMPEARPPQPVRTLRTRAVLPPMRNRCRLGACKWDRKRQGRQPVRPERQPDPFAGGCDPVRLPERQCGRHSPSGNR